MTRVPEASVKTKRLFSTRDVGDTVVFALSIPATLDKGNYVRKAAG